MTAKTNKMAEKKPMVVFPCGALFKDGKWTVSMGINDMASAWIEIPMDHLIKLMQPTMVYRPPEPVPEPAIEAIFI